MAVVLQDLDHLVETVTSDVVRWRRHLHQHPELSYEERKTAQFVYHTLQAFGGFELSRPTRTSVVARLIGSQPGGVVALRADMDALPIQEENEFEFVSQNPGVMHACGHDGHTAALLAVAKILSRMRDEVPGEIRFIFQHAEEVFPGGAQELVDLGVLEGVDAVLGLHLWAPLPVGQIAVKSGHLMAAPDTFYLTIRGQGGHAAQPHLTVDPITIAAQVITNLQHVASRYNDPLEPLVLSVTQISGGTATNVIPNQVEMSGTVRSFKQDLRETVPVWMERIVRGVTEAHGAAYEFRYEYGYRPVVNDERLTQTLRQTLLRVFGPSVVVEAIPTMGGEDFSAYQQAAPGTFFFVGAGNPDKGITYPHHHARFTVDEAALPIAVKAMLAGALRAAGAFAADR
ncbi:MAG: amidohydrolase [Alicyclobacillus herbarius]|uniref:M20 family metallopeptidase n=1 Tax=Alicyclobacillus herbarius TaxID=122960 RepID=UPI002356644B|nr:M20 family metallopeptidase [Alicyclobacillus herbarius]MCL6632443.1 amidohydrolase [Alicyclobacillus herbarius]